MSNTKLWNILGTCAISGGLVAAALMFGDFSSRVNPGG